MDYKFLKQKIAESNLRNQSHLADALGMSKQQLSQKFLSQRPFSVYDIARIKKILKLSNTDTIKCFIPEDIGD